MSVRSSSRNILAVDIRSAGAKSGTLSSVGSCSLGIGGGGCRSGVCSETGNTPVVVTAEPLRQIGMP